MVLWVLWAMCSFRHKVPSGPVIDSDDEHDDRDEHDLDELPNLEDIIRPAIDIVQAAVVRQHDGLFTPESPPSPTQPHDMFYLSPPPPPPPTQQTQPPTQTVTLEEVFFQFSFGVKFAAHSR
jgi:hypothetical protein